MPAAELALLGPDSPPRYVAARVSPNDLVDTLRSVEAIWKRWSDLPFEYSFSADHLVAQYGAERQLGEVGTTFGALAIVIACLGLLGLAAFAAERRRKKIGVRKVLGARAARLVAMLTGDFLKLVAVAFVLAVPLVWLAAEAWLARFAYRTPIGPWPFAIGGATAAVLALGTAGFQALRAARARPVKVLRYE